MPSPVSALTRTTSVSPPYSVGFNPCAPSWPSTLFGSASGRSILFIATTIGTFAARAWLIDSIVCGCTPSAAGTHAGERLVAGRVDERHPLAGPVRPRDLDHPRRDVLRDPPRLARRHVGAADLIQERRLAVVDVPEDRHHRRTQLQLRLVPGR